MCSDAGWYPDYGIRIKQKGTVSTVPFFIRLSAFKIAFAGRRIAAFHGIVTLVAVTITGALAIAFAATEAEDFLGPGYDSVAVGGANVDHAGNSSQGDYNFDNSTQNFHKRASIHI